MNVPLKVRVTVSESGRLDVTTECDVGGVLVAGTYETVIEMAARPATLAEVAHSVYRETVDFERVARAVVEAHESRKTAP